MAFTRIAPLIRIFDENKAKEFYVEFLGFNIDFEHRDSDDAPLYMQVSNYFHECHQYLTFVPKKSTPSTPLVRHLSSNSGDVDNRYFKDSILYDFLSRMWRLLLSSQISI